MDIPLPQGVEDHIQDFLSFCDSLDKIHIADISNKRLLALAFVHKSYAYDYPADVYHHNERLEFLGDGVLGAVINRLLYDNFPQLPESKLTLYKIFLVREETLAQVAQDIGLDTYILLGHGEEKQGGRQKPSVLSDTLEAFIGYLSIDFPPSVVQTFITTYIYSKLAHHTQDASFKSYKSLLQEHIQRQYNVLPSYHTSSETDQTGDIGYVSEVFFETKKLGVGNGKNKKAAEQAAAKNALSFLEQHSL